MTQKFIITKNSSLPFKTIIKGQDAKHIFKVLRSGPGDQISATDGSGFDYTAVIISASSETVEIKVMEKTRSKTESPALITLCTGILKDKKMDFIIKHATQLGISSWIPFYCDRSIPNPDKKRMEKRHQRWRKISDESLKQCRRSKKVNISMPVAFDEIMTKSEDHNLKIAFWEKSTLPIETLSSPEQHDSAIILIGPEGGFTENEISLAKQHGFLSYSLGPRILRAETACISACTLIQHIIGDI